MDSRSTSGELRGAASGAAGGCGGWSPAQVTGLSLGVTSTVMLLFFLFGRWNALGEASTEAGRRYFMRSCNNCHRYRGLGGREELAPSLDGVQGRLGPWPPAQGDSRAFVRKKLSDPLGHRGPLAARFGERTCRNTLQAHEVEPLLDFLFPRPPSPDP